MNSGLSSTGVRQSSGSRNRSVMESTNENPDFIKFYNDLAETFVVAIVYLFKLHCLFLPVPNKERL
jgi:hypothetical protein